MKKSHIAILVVSIVLFLDQWLKIYIKTNLSYQSGFSILGLDWARIYFVENEGMAFGLSFGGEIGKYFLSVFRIIMVGVLIYFLNQLIKAKESTGLIIAFSLIIAGALGNIIDSAFYGIIFEESSPHKRNIAEMFPEAGGYSSFLQGKVVDMLYFPLINTRLPEWIPYWGGEMFSFFKPIFNLADSAITGGVMIILFFYRSFFKTKKDA